MVQHLVIVCVTANFVNMTLVRCITSGITDLWVQETILAINLATAAIFRSKISLSVMIFQLSQKAAINFNKSAINVQKLGLEVYSDAQSKGSSQ